MGAKGVLGKSSEPIEEIPTSYGPVKDRQEHWRVVRKFFTSLDSKRDVYDVLIGHFRVVWDLIVKARLRAKLCI